MAFVYIVASRKNGTLYVGVTSNLERRMYDHKNKTFGGFSSKYDVDRLVYYEQSEDIRSAIGREKRLKRYKREWKIELIEQMNPGWTDLSFDFLESPVGAGE